MIHELISVLCGFVLGFGLGFFFCIVLARNKQRRLERERLARRPEPPIIKAMIQIGRIIEQAFMGSEMGSEKVDNPPEQGDGGKQ